MKSEITRLINVNVVIMDNEALQMYGKLYHLTTYHN